MTPFPDFLTLEIEPWVEKIFQPFQPTRRGEQIAWVSAVVMGIVNGIVYWQEGRFQLFGLVLFLFFALAALLISFSNWVDANTKIYIDSNRVNFKSPLRKVNLERQMIDELWTQKVGGAWRVSVLGQGKYFIFRTESVMGGGSKGPLRIGIEGGEQLTRMIRELGRLTLPVQERNAWVCRKRSG
jgi:hypothetical protein